MDEYTADVSRFGDGIAIRIDGPMTADEKLALASRIATGVCQPGVEGCTYDMYSASHGFLFKVVRSG